MRRFLKTVLVFLLVLALPLQGFAAALKMSCTPEQHAAAEARHVAMLDMPHHDDGSAQHHAHHAMHDHASAHKASGDQADSHKLKHASCGACAACGFGAVAPPGVPVHPPAFASTLSGFISPADLLTGFIPGGLERPPRTLHA